MQRSEGFEEMLRGGVESKTERRRKGRDIDREDIEEGIDVFVRDATPLSQTLFQTDFHPNDHNR